MHVTRQFRHNSGDTILIDSADEVLLQYEGAGYGGRRYYATDERGSVIEVSDQSGATLAINTYDDHGIPAAGNVGRFGYTGQAWMPAAQAWYYHARFYDPLLGRFMQTDPIGYGDGMNWYNYVGGDPVNNTDPSGMDPKDEEIVVEANRLNDGGGGGGFSLIPGLTITGGSLSPDPPESGPPIVVTGKRQQNPDPDVITVTGRRIRLPDLKPFTLYSHFLDGSGSQVCLSSSQFNSLVLAGTRVGKPAPRAGGGYTQQFNLYNTPYANSFGTATLLLDGDRNAVGFHDFYDFDAHARSTVKAQVMTGIGAIGGYLAGGKNFDVDYRNGGC